MCLRVGSINPNLQFVSPVMSNYRTALILFSASSSNGFLGRNMLFATATIARGCWREKYTIIYISVLLGKIIQLS